MAAYLDAVRLVFDSLSEVHRKVLAQRYGSFNCRLVTKPRWVKALGTGAPILIDVVVRAKLTNAQIGAQLGIDGAQVDAALKEARRKIRRKVNAFARNDWGQRLDRRRGHERQGARWMADKYGVAV